MDYVIYLTLPAASVLTLLLFGASYIKSFRKLSSYRLHLLSLPIGWVLTFVFFFVGLVIDPNPTWQDGTAEEPLYFTDFWRVSLWCSFMIQFVSVPMIALIVAVILPLAWNKWGRAEPGAAPNGGPAASVINPKATDGPPSVS